MRCFVYLDPKNAIAEKKKKIEQLESFIRHFNFDC